MNNIYKVIWSKAKNCYVVASEIARSHTKSATGSEKIGGVTRRSLLASLMALSLLCGGLGVASAANSTVHVDESASGAAEVYTKTGVNTLLDGKADKTAVEEIKNIVGDVDSGLLKKTADNATGIEVNRTNINALNATVGDDTKGLTKKINDNTAAIAKKADATELGEYAKTADVNAQLANKADTAAVTTLEGRVAGVEGKVTTLEGTVGDASGGLVRVVNELKTQGNNLNNELGNKADRTDLDAAKEKITTNETNITALQKKTTGLTDDGKSLNGMNSVETDALTVKGEISNGAGVTTTLEKIAASMDRTDMNKTLIGKLNAKTTNITHDANGTSVDGVTFNAGAVTGVTSINGTKIGMQESGKYISQDGSIWGNMKKVDTQVETNEKNIETNKTAITNLDAGLQKEVADREAADAEINKKIGSIDNNQTEYVKKEQTISQNLTKLDNKLKDTNDRTGGITRNDAESKTIIERNVTVDSNGNVTAEGKLKAGSVDAGAITTTGAVNAGSLIVTDASNLKGDVTMDKTLKVTGDTSLNNTDVGGKLNVTGASDLKGNVILGTDTANTVTVNGKADFKAAVNMDKGLTVTNGDTTLQKTDVKGALSVTGESSLKNTTVGGTLGVTGATTLSGELTAEKNAIFEKDVTVRNDLTVDGKLNVGEISMKNNELKNGKKHDSATTITADEISNLAKVTEQGNTTESQFTHNEKGTFNHARDGNNADWKESNSNVTADGVSNKMTDSDGNRHTYYQTAAETKEQLVNGDKSNFEKKTAKGNTISITEKDADGNLKSSLTNTQTVNGEKTSVTNKDSSSTINQGADQIRYNVTSKDANKTSSSIEVKADGITNTSKDGTITNDAKDIVNNATGDMTNNVGGKLTTTVKELATENFNGGLDTTVTGTENHTVNGKQINTVTEGQENIISGGQTNTITGGQINNITGDQTTTITGNKKETVTENVTEDYQKDLTTTVGGDETHEVKGTKTETVEGKLTENFKGGQETNVSGTQTINATDINRNASSGMIDTIDNDYGTNTETKVAGKTTTDVSIKGTGEEGKYIRGANESRDYLIKGTLTNSERKTAEATSTEITDGNGKTSATIQDKTQISGSVTNGTSSAVSNVKADSIHTAVIEGTNTSLISQKKDSITSAVGNGTTSTVIQQGDKDITIASNGGTVGIVGKDIINNATNEITNTAGTKITDKVGNNTRVIDQTSITDTVGTASRKIEDGKITDTAGDSTVTTENGKGTTFAKAGSAAYSTEAGATKDTNIAGNHITTGRVDANELGVSDKDGTKTADLSVKAGEGVKASASDGTTTGSLDVTADEVGSTVKDASGKGSTFKQRIDAIMMESKNVSIKAEETLTNEAKVITNRASEVINNEAININNTATGIIKSKAYEIQNQADKLISNKVGENTLENMEDGKITTSIKNGTKQNLTQSDAEKTEHSVVNGSNSTVNKQTSEEITDAVTNGTTTNVTQNTATSSNNTIADKNGNANTVISTVDGTSFINSKAAAPVTGASGDGTAVNTTIKGNTITTGKVTMDYADVMKDLGVRGNANITGKTTTGSLEVTGTSTLKGDVTMESNATVKKDLTVEGNTNLKNTKVDGTLDVTQKATFGDSVSIAKDLSVDGNATIKGDVTAKSYKVGDKTYISAAGINANDQKITNVADGSISEGSKDAVNGGQLYTVKNDLEGKVNKVGANAAAMANLHPMEFDPDSKWNVAAAIGNYGSETAAALGAFYRPNDDVMVNLSTAFGTGENMVGGGVSVRLGKGGNKLSREENNALKDQVNDLTARMDALLSVLNPNMSKDFPDVPENHWAYEAVSRLAGNDIVQGYPDGEFHGERTMTRYEMAEIIYNALSRGAEAEKELVEEFKPELQAMAASEKATAERAEG